MMGLIKLGAILCLVVTINCEPAANDELKCEDPNQDTTKYFGETLLKDIPWFHVKKEADLNKALEEGFIMIEIDIAYDESDKTLKISGNYKLQDFLVKIACAKNKKKGVKYNIEDVTTFQKLFFDEPEETKRKLKLNDEAFPQWVHINVLKSGENELLTGIYNTFNGDKKRVKCITFSFGWDDKICSPLTVTDVTNMITNAEKFTNVHKNLVIDMANIPTNILELQPTFKTISLIINEENARCTRPKQLSDEIGRIKQDYGDTLMSNNYIPKFLETHEQLCKEVAGGFHDQNKNLDENPDLAELTWKSVTDFATLETEFEEDIIKVDVTDSKVDEMFLGKNFEIFINKIKEKQVGKKLQLNFKNQKAFDAYWNIEYINLEKIPKIPIFIKFEPALDAKGIDFNYQKNKWLECYAIVLSAEGGSGAYDKAQMSKVIDKGDTIPTTKGKMISVNLERAVISGSKDAINLIKIKNTYKLNVIDESHSTELKKVRNFLRENSAWVYLDFGGSEEQVKVFKGVSITEMLPGVDKNLTLLEFDIKPVQSAEDLKAALKKGNTMIQATVSLTSDGIVVGDKFKLRDCLNDLGVNSTNGIKLSFKNSEAVGSTLTSGDLKYLNFPVWLELEVLGANKVDLALLEPKLKKLGHKLVLSFGGAEFKASAMQAEKNKIENIDDVTYKVKTTDFTDKNEEVIKLLDDDWTMLLTSPPGDTVTTKVLRTMLTDFDNYYSNFDKLIMEECPNFEEESEDFSKFTISDFVTSPTDVKNFIKYFNMIRAKITLDKSKLYVGKKFELGEFFETFEESVSLEKSVGIIFTIESDDVYEAAMKFPEMKIFNHRIWFDVKVLKGVTSTATDKIVDLKYPTYNDKLDCRTLLLGIAGSENGKYTQKHIEDLQKITGGIEQKYVFDLKYAMESESWGEIEKIQDSTIMLRENDFKGISADFRKMIEDIENSNIILDIAGRKKYSAWNCPESQDVLSYFNIAESDLSKLVLSNFITSKKDIDSAIEDEVHMLNVKVGIKKDVAIVGETLTLLELLEDVDDRKNDIGIKLTFDKTTTFEAVASDVILVNKIRNTDRPVWISADVIKDKKTDVDLKYALNDDLLDCRTLSLGWTGTGEKKYSKDNVEAMKKLPLGPNPKMYVVDMIHVMSSFDVIKSILLVDKDEESEKPVTRVKPRLDTEEKFNDNKIMLALNDADAKKLKVDGLEEFLNEHADLFFFDMTFEVKKAVFGGSVALSSSLVLALVFALVSIVLG